MHFFFQVCRIPGRKTWLGEVVNPNEAVNPSDTSVFRLPPHSNLLPQALW